MSVSNVRLGISYTSFQFDEVGTGLLSDSQQNLLTREERMGGRFEVVGQPAFTTIQYGTIYCTLPDLFLDFEGASLFFVVNDTNFRAWRSAFSMCFSTCL